MFKVGYAHNNAFNLKGDAWQRQNIIGGKRGGRVEVGEGAAKVSAGTLTAGSLTGRRAGGDCGASLGKLRPEEEALGWLGERRGASGVINNVDVE